MTGGGDDDWLGDCTAGWDDGDGSTPSRQPASDHPRRRWVLIVVCEKCDGTDVQRHNATAAVAYWRCRGCSHTWKEDPGTGMSRALMA